MVVSSQQFAHVLAAILIERRDLTTCLPRVAGQTFISPSAQRFVSLEYRALSVIIAWPNLELVVLR